MSYTHIFCYDDDIAIPKNSAIVPTHNTDHHHHHTQQQQQQHIIPVKYDVMIPRPRPAILMEKYNANQVPKKPFAAPALIKGFDTQIVTAPKNHHTARNADIHWYTLSFVFNILPKMRRKRQYRSENIGQTTAHAYICLHRIPCQPKVTNIIASHHGNPNKQRRFRPATIWCAHIFKKGILLHHCHAGWRGYNAAVNTATLSHINHQSNSPQRSIHGSCDRDTWARLPRRPNNPQRENKKACIHIPPTQQHSLRAILKESADDGES